MLKTYTWPRYVSRHTTPLGGRVPLVVVGAGPVGLAAAIDAGQRGMTVLLLDEDDTVSIGSRGLCWAKRTLEIFDRLGLGDAVVAKGVTWNVGRTYHGEREVFSFDLLPEAGHARPGMVNLQQYHLEQMLVERAEALPSIDLRWRHKVVGVVHHDDGITLEIETPEGRSTLHADWLIAADGARSMLRRLLGLDTSGQVFHDRFLIADVLLDAEPYPADRTERRFWFEPSFHGRHSVLMHRQADQVWRIDFQLDRDADPEVEKDPVRVAPRIRALLDQQGLAHIGFELEWLSVYTFQCRRMARFRHGRVCFVGDAAHQVSPFGARGANSGVQDIDNLVWKIDLVQRGLAPQALLDSYDHERGQAADENLLASARSTDFMSPKSHAARVLRNAVLGLAAEWPMGRALVDSGRLSVPALLQASPWLTPDADSGWQGWMQAGAPLDDAPVSTAGVSGWLLRATGHGFVLLHFGVADAAAAAVLHGLSLGALPLRPLLVLAADEAEATLRGLPAVVDSAGLAARRCDTRPGSVVLLRPDQHVAARWRTLDAAAVRAALARACGHTAATETAA